MSTKRIEIPQDAVAMWTYTGGNNDLLLRVPLICFDGIDKDRLPFSTVKLVINGEGTPAVAERGIPMLLHCPLCNTRHIDVGEFAAKLHHTHACQSCGHCWRPAVVNTFGVQFLPGFKNQ